MKKYKGKALEKMGKLGKLIQVGLAPLLDFELILNALICLSCVHLAKDEDIDDNGDDNDDDFIYSEL